MDEVTLEDVKSLMVKVGVYETDVFGVKAYHCRCFECKWQSKRYEKETQAVKVARKHICEKVKE